MKTKILRLAAFAIFAAAHAFAAPLASTTAVHTKPDASSPAITFLKAGTEPVAAASQIATTPAGWMAIDLPGPFEGYVENKDIAKSLDVKPGSSIRLQPKVTAGVLAIAEKGDKIEITGLQGRWTRVSLAKPLVGYINVGSAPGYLPPIATTPASSAPTATTTTPPANQGTSGYAPVSSQPTATTFTPAPVTPTAYGAASAGQAAPQVDLSSGMGALPRQFVGRFVSTRRPLMPRRPFDYALNDDAGKRFAYLDVSKLLQTEQIEKYIERSVVVFGAARSSPDGKDIVITVETLQLK